VVKVDCRNADTCRYVIVQSLDTVAEKLCIAEACVLETSEYIAGMLTRPAGHEAKAEAEVRKSESEDEAEAQNFFSRPRPRPDTLENNSVCMILSFRT